MSIILSAISSPLLLLLRLIYATNHSGGSLLPRSARWPASVSNPKEANDTLTALDDWLAGTRVCLWLCFIAPQKIYDLGAFGVFDHGSKTDGPKKKKWKLVRTEFVEGAKHLMTHNCVSLPAHAGSPLAGSAPQRSFTSTKHGPPPLWAGVMIMINLPRPSRPARTDHHGKGQTRWLRYRASLVRAVSPDCLSLQRPLLSTKRKCWPAVKIGQQMDSETKKTEKRKTQSDEPE